MVKNDTLTLETIDKVFTTVIKYNPIAQVLVLFNGLTFGRFCSDCKVTSQLFNERNCNCILTTLTLDSVLELFKHFGGSDCISTQTTHIFQ